MKSEIKKALCFIFLIIAYSLQSIEDAYSFSYIYILGFITSVTFLYVIKNKYIGLFAGVSILVAMEFYDTDYKYLTIFAFLLICAHKNLMTDSFGSDKKKKSENGFSYLIVQICFLTSIAFSVYGIFLIAQKRPNLSVIDFNRTLFIFLWILGLFAYSVFEGRNNKKEKNKLKTDKQLSESLKFMYFLSIIAFSATVIYCWAKGGQISISYKSVYFPWFVYICSIVYNGDPYIESLAKKVETTLNIISKADKVK